MLLHVGDLQAISQGQVATFSLGDLFLPWQWPIITPDLPSPNHPGTCAHGVTVDLHPPPRCTLSHVTVHTHTHTHTHMHTYTHAHCHTHTHTHARTHTHTHTVCHTSLTHTHTHIHMYCHTQSVTNTSHDASCFTRAHAQTQACTLTHHNTCCARTGAKLIMRRHC